MAKAIAVGFLCSCLIFATAVNGDSSVSFSETTTNIPRNVPLYPTNLTIKATNGINSNTSLPIATSKRNSIPDLHLNTVSSTSHLLTQYNKQNVNLLADNVEERLKQLRNSELFVPTIQEIFDNFHLSRETVHARRFYTNKNNQSNWTAIACINEDLKVFAQRLSKKLQKAINIVRSLNDFFRHNVTKVLRQTLEEEAEAESEVEQYIDMNNEDDSLNGNQQIEAFDTFLSTVVETFDQVEKHHYNKQQIQILNYIKTDKNVKYLDTKSLTLNNLVEAKMQALKEAQTFEDSTNDISLQQQMSTSRNKLVGNHYKHLYFLSSSDGATDSNFNYDTHFRFLFASSIKRKYVFILLDIGSAMSPELMDLARQYIAQTVQLLASSDLISIVTISHEADYVYLDLYPTEAAQGVYSASSARKEELLLFMNNLNPSNTIANHVLGFEYSFDMLKRLQNDSILNEDMPIIFVYITRGLLSHLDTASQVLQVIANGQSQLAKPIIINTCAVVLDEKRIMHEKQFLTDIANQDFQKYSIEIDKELQQMSSYLEKGKLYILTKNQPDIAAQASIDAFRNFFIEKYVNDDFEVHLPEKEHQHQDVLVSITKAIIPFGVVGVDLYLSDMVDDFVNYHREFFPMGHCLHKYAFLVDRLSGTTLVHPAFPRALTQSKNAFPVDISYLENATDFFVIRHKLLHQENGTYTTKVVQSKSLNKIVEQKTYVWRSVLGIYVLCLVVTNKTEQCEEEVAVKAENGGITSSYDLPGNIFVNSQRSPLTDLYYHRLDLPLNNQVKSCKYFRQLATLDSPTLFLSSLAFESPFTFLINNRLNALVAQTRVMESIMGYLKDTTGLLANPGLRASIRREVNAVHAAMKQLKKRHNETSKNIGSGIIRRYIATVHGVLEVYPGCQLTDDYEPTLRAWFRRAMDHPGQIIVTDPYVDAGGAGHIITIAHTIGDGTSKSREPLAVVGLDVPYTYFYKMILESTHFCLLLNIKCLVFDNEGFLIAHPSMLEPSSLVKNQRRPKEHITHKESYLANDILNHKSLVKKLACANYQNHTLQRYYVFNTSLTETLTNVIHSERTKYALTLIQRTNIFAVVLNSSAEGGAFCPCSTIDRICLNCNRMDQNDCECPCECPMELDLYTESSSNIEQPFINYTQQYDYCLPNTESSIAIPPFDQQQFASCLLSNCEMYSSHYDCIGVIGCEWCQQDFEGNTFPSPFCAAQSTCFNGILSANTPYGVLDELDLLAARGFIPSQTSASYSFFGPVGGAVIVLAIVIGLAVYCYRHNIDSTVEHQFYIDSLQEENYGLPLSRFNFDDCQAHDEPPDGGYDHHAAQRAINPADISPYHMSTGSSYRRPTNGESDHGYSTMTPHEDSSEHQCFALAEPLLLNDKRNSKSDTLSISTSISSPTNRHHQSHHHHHHYHNNHHNLHNHHHHQQQQLNMPPSLYSSKGKESSSGRYYNGTPKKLNSHGSPSKVYEQTTIPCSHKESYHEPFNPHYILAPVTVHRHMENNDT